MFGFADKTALDTAVADAHQVIDAAIEQYKPTHAFALFSGGHDSMTSTHIAMSHPFVSRVVHINTGIGIEQTREYVRSTCRREGWELIEQFPPKLTYRDMVLRYGFPGPGGHLFPYSWLKERSLRVVARQFKVKRRPILFITGVRSQESERRMGHVEPIYKQPHTRWVWTAPIHNWTKLECGDYLRTHDIPRNPVVDNLHMSGECLCGAFARPGELDELRMWYPAVADQIETLQNEAKEAGVHCEWGQRPSPRVRAKEQAIHLPLCANCQGMEIV